MPRAPLKLYRLDFSELNNNTLLGSDAEAPGNAPRPVELRV